MSILLIAGLPFEESFWSAVQQRLTSKGHSSHAWVLCQNEGSIQKQRNGLHQAIAKHSIDTIVAHGLSLPLAIEAYKTSGCKRLILSNGLLTTKVGLSQWILPRLLTIPCTVKKQLLRPNIILPILASSAAFRRLVINPYVMDRTTIDSLTKELLTNADYRQNVSTYLRELDSWKLPENLDGEIHTIWGDHDLLFPIEQLEFLSAIENIRLQTHRIEGGAHFHPVERPWSIADHIASVLKADLGH